MGNMHEALKNESKVRPLQEQAGRVVDDLRELGHVAANSAGEVARDLREQGATALQAGKEKATQVGRSIHNSVTANPWKSVLIAAGVGAAIGFALRRAR